MENIISWSVKTEQERLLRGVSKKCNHQDTIGEIFLDLVGIFLQIDLFMAALGLGCCARAFSICGAQGLLSSCRVRASNYSASSCCSAWAPGTWAWVVVAHGLHCPLAGGIFPDQGLNPCPLHWQEILYHWATREAQVAFLMKASWTAFWKAKKVKNENQKLSMEGFWRGWVDAWSLFEAGAGDKFSLLHCSAVDVGMMGGPHLNQHLPCCLCDNGCWCSCVQEGNQECGLPTFCLQSSRPRGISHKLPHSGSEHHQEQQKSPSWLISLFSLQEKEKAITGRQKPEEKKKTKVVVCNA